MLPVYGVLGNPYAAGRILMRYDRGKGLLGRPDAGERHIREGRQMYPNTSGKTITTIAAHTA
jgi:hypothetical protein